ncbi:Acetyltransferase, GNAT family [Oceanobacillus limi]|uniref:Acetyltransferase, GNAT family n=1 Tax=Oceanobacillus limi TaxID=930131 RepID=A0A1I0BJ09_9BACI|nr:GNAT family N-acetyltransferase [Oceanobacillus limi]SET06973.1 Acetyltransferase, GNAT family [Oceanobacillus limi]
MKLIPWTNDKLEEIVELWNNEVGESFPMLEELFEQNSFLDENICLEGSRIAVTKNNQVIGFLVAKRWQEELQVGMKPEFGWIQVLIVKQSYRKQGIGKHLLDHAEEVFQSKGVKRIILGRDPWHYFPGIPEQFEDVCRWFEHKGYEKHGTDYDLIRSYNPIEKHSIPNIKDVEFALLKTNEKEHLLDFLHRCFPGRWEYEAITYFERGGTGREFVVLKKKDQIIGFCRINDSMSPLIAQNVYWAPLFKEELGGIGPLGIDAKERKNGYGLAIVEAGIAFLRERGINRIVIDWTGLVDFYQKLGYGKWKTYKSYRKDL